MNNKLQANKMMENTKSRIINYLIQLNIISKQREEITSLQTQLEKLEQENRQLKKYHRLSYIDPLTNIGNRRYFDEKYTQELNRVGHNGSNFSLALIDIDFFKKINDTYGHECGDFILQQFAKYVKTSLRKMDSISRIGGEEFIVILPDTDKVTAHKVVERIRQGLENITFTPNNSDKKINVTFSCGVVEYTEDEGHKQMVNTADKRLYHAKQTGRNQVIK